MERLPVLARLEWDYAQRLWLLEEWRKQRLAEPGAAPDILGPVDRAIGDLERRLRAVRSKMQSIEARQRETARRTQ